MTTTLAAPTPYNELVAAGCTDAIPCPRDKPYVRPAVLFDKHTGTAYFPGELGLMAAPMEHFDWLVKEERATKMAADNAPQAIVDGCIYFPEGDTEPEYVSLTVALERLQEFCARKTAEGDALAKSGRRDQALRAYELVARGQPEVYARMLLMDLPPRRRERVERQLAQVATRPVGEYLAEARAVIGGFMDALFDALSTTPDEDEYP